MSGTTRSYPAGLNLLPDQNLRMMLMVLYDQLSVVKATADNPLVTPADIASVKAGIANLQTQIDAIRIQAYRDFQEISDPLGPGKDIARLYSRDNGSGKTQLVVRFPTGAVQVLATEP